MWGESIFFIRSTDVEKADKLSGILTPLLACVCIARMERPVCQGRLCFRLFLNSLGLNTGMDGIFGCACTLFGEKDLSPSVFGH